MFLYLMVVQKVSQSGTLKVTTAFLEGLNSNENHNIEIVNISKANIDHCHGCFACWTKTPGKCVIKDDMEGFIEQYIKADLIMWSFLFTILVCLQKLRLFLTVCCLQICHIWI